MDYKKIGITQKELAKKLYITDKAVSKWERGDGLPDISIIQRLSKELNVSVIDILNGEKVDKVLIEKDGIEKYVDKPINFIITKNKEMLNKIIVVCILVISLLFIFLNIINVYKLNNKNHSMSYQSNNKWPTYYQKLQKNINIINNNQGKYIESDYKIIKEKLNVFYESVNNSYMIKNITNSSDDMLYSLNELYIICGDIDFLNLYNTQKDIFEILEKYGINKKKMNHDAAEDAKILLLSKYAFIEKYSNNYRYLNLNNNFAMKKVIDENVESLPLDFYFFNMLCLTEKIMEVGEIYE